MENSSTSDKSKWFVNFIGLPVKPNIKVLVYLLGHAGGTTSDFRRWDHYANSSIRLIPVALPGRATRSSELQIEDISVIADKLCKEILETSFAGTPIALFGQSFGSLIAFETAVRMTKAKRPPLLLAVSARRPPNFPDPRPGECKLSELLSDEAFIQGLCNRYGDDTLGKLYREQPELTMRFVPQMRNDIGAFDRYLFDHEIPSLTCPIFACAGKTDPRITEEEGAAWSVHTTAPGIEFKRYPGGHFFVRDEKTVKLLVEDLCCLLMQALPPIVPLRHIQQVPPPFETVTDILSLSATSQNIQQNVTTSQQKQPEKEKQQPEKPAPVKKVEENYADMDDPDFPACF